MNVQLMKERRMPPVLHEIFGEEQSIATLLTIMLFGGALSGGLLWIFPEMTHGLPLWRSLLALILIFDIFAGCIANFTVSTSNYYAARATLRLVFLAVHFHLIAIAALLQTTLWHALAVWAYTICGAAIVNSLIGKRSQLIVAGLLLAVGIGCLPMLPDIPPYMLTVSLLFLLKVLFSFAVNHYGQARIPEA